MNARFLLVAVLLAPTAMAQTPKIDAVVPNSSQLAGGTRVTIMGGGFQQPLLVFFGGVEAVLLRITSTQIIVIAPPAPEPGRVDVTVININSDTRTTLPAGFRYFAPMTVSRVTPSVGPSAGGTQVRIEGSNFEAPLHLLIGGLLADPIEVTPTSITAITKRMFLVDACELSTGPVVVTSIESGDRATGASFTVVIPSPQILSVTPSSVAPEDDVEVVIANAEVRQSLLLTRPDDIAYLLPRRETRLDADTVRMTFRVPRDYLFPKGPCTIDGHPGIGPQPFVADVIFTAPDERCFAHAKQVLTITPKPNTGCIPHPQANVLAPEATGAACPTVVASADDVATILFANRAHPSTPPLRVLRAAITGPHAREFTIDPPGYAAVVVGEQAPFRVAFTPEGPGVRRATVTFTTNDPERPTLTVCLIGRGPLRAPTLQRP